MCVAYEVLQRVIDHGPFVKGVVLEEAIVPALLLAAEVVRVEASEFVDGGGGIHGSMLRT